MKFYYIPLSKGEKLTHIESEFHSVIRNSKYLVNDDYPTHRHMSSGSVFIMELIPESRMLNVKYLYMHKSLFKTIELEKGEYFRDGFGRYFMTEFEKEHNTEEYKYHMR